MMKSFTTNVTATFKTLLYQWLRYINGDGGNLLGNFSFDLKINLNVDLVRFWRFVSKCDKRVVL